jgi:hypothetical protein
LSMISCPKTTWYACVRGVLTWARLTSDIA